MATWFDIVALRYAHQQLDALGYRPYFTVAAVVVDNGFDLAHPGLSVNRVYDYDSGTAKTSGVSPDSVIKPGNSHGTQSVGLICGAENSDAGFQGGAVASRVEADIAVARYCASADFGIDYKMFTDLAKDNRVISNSYGWSVTTAQRNRFGQLFDDIGTARSTLVFAAGNSNEELKQQEYMRHAIMVAASVRNPDGTESKAPNSNWGAGITVCAPVGGVPPLSTCNMGEGTGGSHYSDHGDTSAACPMVAGLATLMLIANPALTPPKVKEILCLTAVKIDSAGGGWGPPRSVMSQGQFEALPAPLKEFRYSKLYGFGRINALSAVVQALRA